MVVKSPDALAIPSMALSAYRHAEQMMAASYPECGIGWNLLAGIVAGSSSLLLLLLLLLLRSTDPPTGQVLGPGSETHCAQVGHREGRGEGVT